MTESSTNIERIIAKIDNDFNPDQSDWIPRVGAWAIDAMSTLKVLKKHNKVRKIPVKDRIAYSPCSIDTDNIKVFDSNGCEIKESSRSSCSDCSPSTGKGQVADTNSAKTLSRYDYAEPNPNKSRDYIIVDDRQIELNFDTDFISIQSNEVKTKYSSTYNSELPIIPNNGTLIEAIVSWCMYKMLCRGYKHTVLNLRDNSPATNPYIAWLQLKEDAKTSVILDAQGDVIDDGGAWRSAFYIFTFDPKNK